MARDGGQRLSHLILEALDEVKENGIKVIGELHDAATIASLMITQGVTKLCLAGFSFGGSIAARLVVPLKRSHPDCEVIDLLQVAPAVENFPIEPELLVDVPCKVMLNSDDEIVSPQAIADYADIVEQLQSFDLNRGHFSWGAYATESCSTSHYQRRGFV